MITFAANLTMMFGEWEFLDRFEAAAEAGFDAVEYLFPYAHPPEAIEDRLGRLGLRQAMFNMPPGDWDAGERGIACLEGRFDEFRDGVGRALEYAEATGARKLHMMAGIGDPKDPHAARSYRRAVAHAAERLAERNLELLLEPINPRSMPGYFLNDFSLASDVIAGLGIPNVRLQYDLFHRQIMHGDVTMSLQAMMPVIGHVQVAGVPARNEPDDGELNLPYVVGELRRAGYAAFIGCEYNPRGRTVDGLGWFPPYRSR